MIIKHGRHICLRNAPGAQRFVEFFFLIVLFGCWLAVQAKSNHVGVLVSLLLLLFPFISVYVDGWLWRLPLTWMLLLVLSKFAWNLTHVIRANQHPKRKKPTYLCAPREFLKKYLPCVIILHSCYFNLTTNIQTSRMLSVRDLCFVFCSLDFEVLHVTPL